MAEHKFLIQPHFRLHEWVAEQKGYFAAEGLDYDFQETVQSSDGKAHAQGDKSGAMQSFEKGRTSDISCACHWTVNVAAAKGHGKLYGDAYSVSPCGVFVPPDSKITSPEQLAGVPISVGYQSGSHYATIQALEQYMPLDQINLSYKEGMLFARMDLLVRGQDPGLHAVLGAVLLRRAARLPQGDRLHLHDGEHDHRRARSGGCAQVLPCVEARAAGHRPAARALHALLQTGISQALSRPDGHAPLGPGRAHRVRALLAGHLRGVARLDPRARHLRGERSRREELRERGGAGWRSRLPFPRPAKRGEGGEVRSTEPGERLVRDRESPSPAPPSAGRPLPASGER